MQWSELNLNRFGFKSEPDPVAAGATEMSSDVGSSVGGGVSDSGSQETPGAKEVITGTVITKCLVQTSGSDFRVELNSVVTAQDSGLSAGTQNSDSLVAYNGNDTIMVLINKYGLYTKFAGVEHLYVTDVFTVATPIKLQWVSLVGTDQAFIYGDDFGNLYLNSKGGAAAIYLSEGLGTVIVTGNLDPLTDNTYDLGNVAYKWKEGFFYQVSTDTLITDDVITDNFSNITKSIFNGSVVACPLPTVEKALDIIKKIPDPVKVGDRGHYGDKLYFDDLTFPEEVLWEIEGKKEIEHTHMIGLLMQAVRELTKKVESLESKLP